MPSAAKMLLLMVIAVSLFNGAGLALLAQPCDPAASLCPPEMPAGFMGRFWYAAGCFAPVLMAVYVIGFIAVLAMIGSAGDIK